MNLERCSLFALLLPLAVGLAGCTAEVEEEGRLPEVEVEGGRLPKVDVEPAAEVEISRDTQQVIVPDVEVR